MGSSGCVFSSRNSATISIGVAYSAVLSKNRCRRAAAAILRRCRGPRVPLFQPSCQISRLGETAKAKFAHARLLRASAVPDVFRASHGRVTPVARVEDRGEQRTSVAAATGAEI